MVLRTLKQDVVDFWRYCREQSGANRAAPDPITLASKMVGRWPSGAPITLHQHADPGIAHQDEDRFGYAKQDADGSRCPYGAHVRRSNPRDHLLANTAVQSMEVANRHRIIRRGRAYGNALVEPLDASAIVDSLDTLHNSSDPALAARLTEERGLHFICFQGNIERQFEFVQQQWCNNPKFGGMNSEADPVIGFHQTPGPDMDAPVFTIPDTPVRRRALDMRRFVDVRGSGYFFMPSLTSVRYLATLAG
jgi:deferrochelatase/peroxidase EfeB